MNSLLRSQFLFFGAAILCITPIVSAPFALLTGLIIAQLKTANPIKKPDKAMTLLLQVSIVLMGFGINLSQAFTTSAHGIWMTILTILTTFSLGFIIARILRLDPKIAFLLSGGTAICGGSAIAALSSAIKADNQQTTLALSVVFILNAVALFVFPPIGHWLSLSQESFGFWSALAIHDTSSVVGASSAYGNTALAIATTTKLTRALWIIPISLVAALFFNKGERGNIRIPFFIGGFIAAMLLAYFIPQWSDTYVHLSWLGKKSMHIALFLLGSTLTIQHIKQVNLKLLVSGIAIWIFISVLSLYLITL